MLKRKVLKVLLYILYSAVWLKEQRAAAERLEEEHTRLKGRSCDSMQSARLHLPLPCTAALQPEVSGRQETH